MNILGLIVEYNPFHNGHLYHLKKSKEITNSTHVVAIMSGNFLQRGEPSLFDKYTRAKAAILNGVDLVIELPTIFACQSAEFFSHGAISTLNSLNCINSICFGSEHGSIQALKTISEILVEEPIEFIAHLKENLNSGMLFPNARGSALFDYITNNHLLDISKDTLKNILNSPNNILGIEYLKSLIKLKSNIKPYTITRIESSYNSDVINSSICSATAIRKVLKDENNNLDKLINVVPLNTHNVIKASIDDNFYPMFDDYYFNFISSIIVRDNANLNKYFDVNEGIENKIYQSVFASTNLLELQMAIKSKRYTHTKIKRILNNILLGITKDDVNLVKNINPMPYVRILAFNDNGRDIIKSIKQNSDINIINKFSKVSFNSSDDTYKTLINYDIKGTNMYNLIYYKNNSEKLKGPMDYYNSPIYIKS